MTPAKPLTPVEIAALQRGKRPDDPTSWATLIDRLLATLTERDKRIEKMRSALEGLHVLMDFDDTTHLSGPWTCDDPTALAVAFTNARSALTEGEKS